MDIKKELQKRILVLDGAMGTAIQKYNLNSDDYLGKKGCNEILNITRPDILKLELILLKQTLLTVIKSL